MTFGTCYDSNRFNATLSLLLPRISFFVFKTKQAFFNYTDWLVHYKHICFRLNWRIYQLNQNHCLGWTGNMPSAHSLEDHEAFSRCRSFFDGLKHEVWEVYVGWQTRCISLQMMCFWHSRRHDFTWLSQCFRTFSMLRTSCRTCCVLSLAPVWSIILPTLLRPDLEHHWLRITYAI